MADPIRVAVTGAGGRLGRALVAALERRGGSTPLVAIAWDRSAFDLDRPELVGARLDGDRPDAVVHAAAWTDVDACALDPALAERRNGVATGALARACAERGIGLVVISTNEVFDGTRTDGVGYGPADPPNPANAYGASKLAGERAAAVACEGAGAGANGAVRLGIVRTAWLFGPGRPDFPRKIAAAAARAAAGHEPLRVVGDEFGTPSYGPDVAQAIVRLLETKAWSGIHHVVNDGVASRAAWAREVLDHLGLRVPIEEVPLATFERPSRPPRWGVLAATPLPGGGLRSWQAAMAAYAPDLARASR